MNQEVNKDSSKLSTVMNPVVENRPVARKPLSPRLDTLEGKTLYMVDINWGGPDAAPSVFRQMSRWLAEHMPTVRTEYRLKNGMYVNDDPKLWDEIKAKGDAAIVGISG